MPSDPDASNNSLAKLPVKAIQSRVHTVRGAQVLLDEDLAEFYGVTTGRSMEQVRRNEAPFPSDFMIQLTEEEFADLKSQNAISSSGHGGRRKLPHAFTEQGVAMLSGLLRSEQAIAVNVEIMRAFFALRRMASEHADLKKRIEDLERDIREELGGHDEKLTALTQILHALTQSPPTPPKKQIGFAPPPAVNK